MVSIERSPQASRARHPVRNFFFGYPPKLADPVLVEELSAGEGGGLVSALFMERCRVFSFIQPEQSRGGSLPSQYQPGWSTLAAANYSSGSVVVFKLMTMAGSM